MNKQRAVSILDQHLKAIESRARQRSMGKKVSGSDGIRRKIKTIEKRLAAEDLKPLGKVKELTELHKLQSKLEEALKIEDTSQDVPEAIQFLTEDWGVPYEVWREAGVEPATLRKAGFPSRGRRKAE